ncbi:MAG: ATP-binding cassette domain-containing protein, partial [Lactobacillus sp.]|nr:ATP-binding cassette domain-containing protein [Lactobacillus sp.]
MITIKNLTFAYNTKPIIKDLNLTLPSGFSLLVGPTGCGKSTLLKLIAGLYPKYAGKISSGNIDLHQQKTAMMFQNAGEQFTMPTPREEIVFALENLQLSNTEYKKRLSTAVDFTKINRLLDQKISTMSGGEKQRVALAVLIAMDVDILILDEPFASCDPESRHFLINKLKKLRSQGKTILISDHVLSDYQGICDYVYKFEHNIVKKLSQTEAEELFTPKNNSSHAFSLPKSNKEATFEFNKVQISQNRLLLDQAYLKIFANKVTLLTGANGVGKSSLFKALSKMLPYTGSIRYHKREVQ